MERTELKMALIAEQLGLSWAGECVGLDAPSIMLNCSCLVKAYLDVISLPHTCTEYKMF